jgi:hypothetical protein
MCRKVFLLPKCTVEIYEFILISDALFIKKEEDAIQNGAVILKMQLFAVVVSYAVIPSYQQLHRLE